ncbi:MAG: MFS transporter [Dehalococcoidia bacterium]
MNLAGSTAPPPGGRTHTESRHASPRLLLLLLGLGVFIGTFDQTVVVTILPNLIKDLGLPVAHFGQATWIVNGYLLGYTVAMPIVGRLADVYGHVRLYLISLAIFILGSAAVALAPNLGFLVAARTFQAVGGGGVLPVAMAIASDVLPRERRPLILGGLAATNNASSLLGPLWGAAVVGIWSWRAIFWLNIPLVAPVLIALPMLARQVSARRSMAVDWTGAGLLTIAIGAGTVALTDDGANPRPLLLSLGIAAVSLLCLIQFVRHEWKSSAPMIQVQSFRQHHFSAAMLMYFLIGGALITALVDVPLMTDVLFAGSPLQGGLNLMRLLLLLPIGGVAGGLLSTRIGYRATAVLGLLTALGGFFLIRAWPSIPSSGQLWSGLGLIGLGLGLCDAPIVSTVVDHSRSGERATATALLLVVWTSGMIVGLALLGTQGLGSFNTQAARLFREQGTQLQTTAIQHLMRQTFNATFIAAACALAVALLFAVWLQPGRGSSIRWSTLTGLEE